MSYKKFTTEASNLLGTRPDLSVEATFVEVRKKWIDEKQFDGLVSFILTNWDAGNCVDFMLPVAVALLENQEFELHERLWTRTIKRQIDGFFENYAALKPHGVNIEEVMSFDHKGFNEFRMESYNHSGRASSFFLHRAIDSLAEWRRELIEFKRETNIPEHLDALLRKLKKPKAVDYK